MEPVPDVGKCIGQVGVLADVVDQIVELDQTRLVELDQLVAPASYRATRGSALVAVVRVVPLDRVANERGSRAGQDRHDRLALHAVDPRGGGPLPAFGGIH